MERGTVTCTSGAELSYEVRGSGPPVVMVAGLGDDLSSWSAQVERLSGSHTVVAFDNRGSGGSSTPPGPYTIQAMADDAHDLVNELGLGPVSAVGSSMGGAICQRWALRHPGDISRLVLTNTWGEGDVFTNTLFDHWIALAGVADGPALLGSLLLFSFSAGYLVEHPEIAREFLASDPPALEGFEAAAQACRGHSALEEAHDIRQPTLVIAGSEDILTRPALSVRLAERIPDARLERLDAGHMVFWERPEAFNDLLLEFL
jgi:3-oxoadipate enol-lactonase